MSNTLEQTQYGQDFDRYVSLCNRKIELEHQIRQNANDDVVLVGLRSEYRKIVEESDNLYCKYYQSFNDISDGTN